MSHTRVKICGITRPEDARAAEAAGAEAIGMVFYDKSPRCVETAMAARIVTVLGPFTRAVGLFVNAPENEVQAVIEETGIDLLQFHGDEDEAFCARFDRPYLKAIRMRPGMDPVSAASVYTSAAGILFDTWSDDKYGGTGVTFDWARVPGEIDKPIILAGGLTAQNVAAAVAATKPYAVDVSGGVESSPGIKSEQLINDFIRSARAAD